MSMLSNIRAIGRVIAWPLEAKEYVNPFMSIYYSKRYDKYVTIEKGFVSDGASCCPNFGISWLVHDKLFRTGKWNDGSPVKWRQANRVMLDIMEQEGQPKWVRWLIRKGINSKYGLKAWKERRKADGVNNLDQSQLRSLLS